MTVRVVLPHHLRMLANVGDEVSVRVNAGGTTASVLDALEEKYPVLQGTIRDHGTLKRRPFIRFFACERDLTFDAEDASLPASVLKGDEPFLVIGAIAGG